MTGYVNVSTNRQLCILNKSYELVWRHLVGNGPRCLYRRFVSQKKNVWKYICLRGVGELQKTHDFANIFFKWLVTIHNISLVVDIMTWYWTGDKSLRHYLNQWLPSSLTRICVTGPERFNGRSCNIGHTLQWRHTGAMTSQITGRSPVCLRAVTCQHQRKHHNCALLACLWGESIGDRWIPLTKGQ